MSTTRRAFLRGSLSLGAAAAVCTPALHLAFQPSPADLESDGPLSAWGRGLLEAVLERAERGEHLAGVRRVNPEWDLIERMVAGLALANVALRDPRERARVLVALDGLCGEAETATRRAGQGHYLLPYARHGRWRGAGRSLFVDGELAVLHGARLLVQDDPTVRAAFRRRVGAVRASMEAGPLLCGESYPDECWTFCNAAGLVALRMAEVLDGADHRSLRTGWVAHARRALIDPGTGLLVSAFTYEGRATQPPEGSSLWWSAHALRLVDPAFARAQYRGSVDALANRLLGFAWAGEWPAGTPRQLDIDWVGAGGSPVVRGPPPASQPAGQRGPRGVPRPGVGKDEA